MDEKSCIICMTELSDEGKEAVESLQRCYSNTIEEHNAIVAWYKKQIEWYQGLVERLMKSAERRTDNA